jgi:hypothetical protein
MEEGVTPYVWSTLAKYGTINHSFEIAKQTLSDWGVKISVKRISSLTYKFGAEGLSIRNAKILAQERNLLSTCVQLKDKRVIISVDGGRTRVRIYQQKKPNPKTQRKKYTGEWIEPKLLNWSRCNSTENQLVVKSVKFSPVKLITLGKEDQRAYLTMIKLPN